MEGKSQKKEKEELTMQPDDRCSAQVGLVTSRRQAVDYSAPEKTWQATVKSSPTAGEYKSFTPGHISPRLLLFLPKYADRAERQRRLSDRQVRQ